MRQLVLDDYGALSVHERAPSALRPGEVRVRVRAAGICGSDVHGYTGASGRRRPGQVMGHELSGIVLECAPDVADLPPGAPVALNPAVVDGTCSACRAGLDQLCPNRRLYGCVPELPGGFADEVVVLATNAVALHGPAPLEWGALVEPLAVGDHAVRLLDEPGEGGVLVVGGGPIGLAAALAARRYGHEPVVVVEPNAHRREKAGELGFEGARPDDPGLSRRSFAGAIECVAAAGTLELALAHVGPRGDVVLVGMAEPVIPLPMTPLVVGERRLLGSFNYTRQGFAEVASWVMSGGVDLAPMVEDQVELEELPAVFAQYASGERAAVKTVLRGRDAVAGD